MRLGHVGEKSLQILAKHGLLKGIKTCKLDFCEHCVLGKQRRVWYGTAIHNTKGIWDYVHSNVWGPTKTPSIGGRHYSVTFVDDFSRKVWVYTKKNKNGVLGVFLKWNSHLENQTGERSRFSKQTMVENTRVIHFWKYVKMWHKWSFHCQNTTTKLGVRVYEQDTCGESAYMFFKEFCIHISLFASQGKGKKIEMKE